MFIIVVLISFALGGIVLYASINLLTHRQMGNNDAEVWLEVADTLGGRLDGPALDGPERHHRKLTVDIGGCRVVAKQCIEKAVIPSSTGAGTKTIDTTVTRVRAALDCPGLLILDLKSPVTPRQMRREGRDRFPVLNYTDEVVAEIALSSRVMELANRTKGYSYRVRGKDVEAELGNIERDPRRLMDAMKVVAELGCLGRKCRDRFSDVAERLGARIEGTTRTFQLEETRLVLSVDHRIISIDVEAVTPEDFDVPNKLFTRITGEFEQPKLDRFAIYRDDPPRGFTDLKVVKDLDDRFDRYFWCVAEDHDRTRLRLTKAVCDEIVDVGLHSITADGVTVTLRFEGLELNVESLRWASEVAAKISASMDERPYR